jgi:hypothetical protein
MIKEHDAGSGVAVYKLLAPAIVARCLHRIMAISGGKLLAPLPYSL